MNISFCVIADECCCGAVGNVLILHSGDHMMSFSVLKHFYRCICIFRICYWKIDEKVSFFESSDWTFMYITSLDLAVFSVEFLICIIWHSILWLEGECCNVQRQFGDFCPLYGTANCSFEHLNETSCTFVAGRSSVCMFITMSNILACILYALGCFIYLAYLVNRSRVMIRVAYVVFFFSILACASVPLISQQFIYFCLFNVIVVLLYQYVTKRWT